MNDLENLYQQIILDAARERYGALMYLEPDSKYTLTASTDNAYNASDNKYIHSGEHVWLACSDGTHTGEGFVTTVSGTSFTVEVTDGSFYMGETVSVYRDSGHASKSRIGRGDIERIGNISVGGSSSDSGSSMAGSSGSSASVVAVHVSDGDHVNAGDLLAETLSGEFDAYYFTGTDLVSGAEGILASVNLTVGGSVAKGDVIATVYARDNLQLKATVNETDLAVLPVGTPVQISFSWNEDAEDADILAGTVSRVLYTAEASGSSNGAEAGLSEGSSAASYAVYIDFDADETTRVGMTATVRPAAGEDQAGESEAADGE